ncbi:hypothetical protein BUALT_Bualt01G0099800 [Buddleja alternifolia]|uniref:Uncharacterized protein n=1 Tax=Buddleja alternifolia TaxID=168488 RepID=A0AAV6Y6Y6_9LAMI|nr:hypothetical protein BUALT_Bualt01G0099800 [Buddleja alternifolia]
MKTGCRRRHGAHLSIFPNLRRHIDSASSTICIESYNVDKLVDHLRSEYREYHCKPRGPFTKSVNQIIVENSRRIASKRRKVGDGDGDVLYNSGGPSSSVTTSSSSSEATYDSWEDAVHGEKFIDLTKSMLRGNLANKQGRKRKEVKEAVELEIDNNNNNNKKDVKTKKNTTATM